MNKLTYNEFVKNVLSGESYSNHQLKLMFKALAAMDNESRFWFIRCMISGYYPQNEIEGFTVEKLMSDLHYSKVEAFLVFDWLKHDPQGALYHITKPVSTYTVGEKTVNEMKDYLRKKGVEILDNTANTPEYIDDSPSSAE